MLDEWLKPVTLDAFVRDLFRKQPYASPSTAMNAVPVFGWDTLDELLTGHPEGDILVVARGKLAERSAPRNLAEVWGLMRDGIGLVIRRAERHDSGLARLAAALTRDIPGKAHVQLFVTPAGSYGFGWHYDDEEVFILQTHGAKDYFFRANTVEHDRPPERAPDFTRFSDETSPLGTAPLITGDWLYLPSRWWHAAKCIEDSLSVSLGVLPDEAWMEKIKQQSMVASNRTTP